MRLMSPPRSPSWLRSIATRLSAAWWLAAALRLASNLPWAAHLENHGCRQTSVATTDSAARFLGLVCDAATLLVPRRSDDVCLFAEIFLENCSEQASYGHCQAHRESAPDCDPGCS